MSNFTNPPGTGPRRKHRHEPEGPTGLSLAELKTAAKNLPRDLENLARVQASRPMKPPGRTA